jgi:DNA-binding beta-propeller fold protein YncE
VRPNTTVALAVAASVAPHAAAQLYGVGPWKLASPTPSVYTFDADTGAGTALGPVRTPIDFVGMTWDGQRLLMATERDVYTIDPETGEGTHLHPLGELTGFREGGIAASPDGSTLYLINRTSFGRMNLATGDAELVYDDRNGLDSSGLTFDGDGRLIVLYHNGSASRLSEIDPATGNVARIIASVNIPRSLPSVGGLAYDTDARRLYATVNSTLFDLTDPANPVAVGDMGIDRVAGLAFVPDGSPCPADLAEPFGVLDLADISAFVGAFVSGAPGADLDGNGIFDLADVVAFVASFTAGCP